MKKLLTAVFLVAAGLGLSACTPPPPMEGTITGKYIEDFTEHTVIFVERGTGDVHHFQVELNQWNSFTSTEKNPDGSMKLNIPFNTRNLQQQTETD